MLKSFVFVSKYSRGTIFWNGAAHKSMASGIQQVEQRDSLCCYETFDCTFLPIVTIATMVYVIIFCNLYSLNRTLPLLYYLGYWMSKVTTAVVR